MTGASWIALAGLAFTVAASITRARLAPPFLLCALPFNGFPLSSTSPAATSSACRS